MNVIPFSAALMAGGKSSRMGADKAHLEIDGIPLWRRQVETLVSAGADEVLISGDPKGSWDNWSGPILADDEPEVGPLSGLITALRRAQFPLVLVLAVDMPAMTSVALRRLLQEARPPTRTEAGRGVVPFRGNQFYEPLAAVYPREALRLAEACRDERCFAVQAFAARAVAQGLVQGNQIAPDEEKLFANINSPQAWKVFMQEKNPISPEFR